MDYNSGDIVRLGDLVEVELPDGQHQARVVMIGETGEHVSIAKDTVAWMTASGHVGKGRILIEWVTGNPLEHGDQNFAPVSNTLSLTLAGVVLRQRAVDT